MGKDRTGEVWENIYKTKMTIVEYRNEYNMVVEFESGYRKNVMITHLKKGNILCPDDEKIYGIIYLIKNKINNKIYIGQTTNTFRQRYSNNLKNSSRGILKDEIELYGLENFEIDEVFDKAYSEEELYKLESLYIKVFETNRYTKGYNIRKCEKKY